MGAHGRAGSPIAGGGSHLRRGSEFTDCGDNEKAWAEMGFESLARLVVTRLVCRVCVRWVLGVGVLRRIV